MNKIAKVEIPPVGIKIGYCRVSTVEQRLDLQTDALRRFGVEENDLYVEPGVSAIKKRPILDLAIKALQPGDTLVVWKLDRIARSMTDLLERVRKIEEAGAALMSLTETFDTKTPGGRFLLYVLGAAAALERELIAERTTAGMEAKKKRGFDVGRPLIMTAAKKDKAEKMLKTTPAPDVAAAIGVSVASIYAHFTVKTVKGKRIIKRKPQK